MKHQKCMKKFSNEQYRINCPRFIMHFFIIEIKSDTGAVTALCVAFYVIVSITLLETL
ncbi:hypothetical protein [Monoglobus pectinilyticus]|uniref:hypothetical protein n=1 Tax=Monoglobus pectinilyticus TaxID=1981510 RepID=UPI003AB495CA